MTIYVHPEVVRVNPNSQNVIWHLSMHSILFISVIYIYCKTNEGGIDVQT